MLLIQVVVKKIPLIKVILESKYLKERRLIEKNQEKLKDL